MLPYTVNWATVMVDYSSNCSDKCLRGRRIGFYTSVVGMGGSEVLVADAMEAACAAGAEIVCWSEAGAAIRKITEFRRERLSVAHNDWPIEGNGKPNSSLAPASTASPRAKSRVSKSWRAVAPFAVKRLLGFRRMAKDFMNQLRETKPHLLVVNVNGSEAVSSAGAALGIPVVNVYHLSLTRSVGNAVTRFGDYVARRTTIWAGDLTVHTSAAVRDQWCGAFRYPADRTRLIYNGVDPLPLGDRESKRRELGFKPDEFVFCVPGRLDPVKGHEYLIEAIRRVRERLSKVVVIVCGDGSLRADLETRARDAEVTEIIRFLGWRNDLPEVLHAADCTVLPSIASENLSVAVLEAMMAGRPAIVSRVGGMAEAVIEGRNGFVVPPADAGALGDALLRMSSDRATASRMGDAAREEALARFTRERMMADYVTVFAEALQRFSPRASQ